MNTRQVVVTQLWRFWTVVQRLAGLRSVGIMEDFVEENLMVILGARELLRS